MDIKDIRTLRILEEIDGKRSPSQRYLAKKLNISLGLVNSFIKRLAQKGYFKIKTIPKNRVKYILTTKGIIAKTRLTYEYIHYSFQYYKDARQKLIQLFKEMDEGGMKNIVFYGASDLAEIAYLSLQETSLQLKALIGASENGKTFLGIKIEDPAVLDHMPYDIILITSIGNHNELIADLLKRGIEREKIVTL
jgi:DNA-binding MarR family transcriptional regulator